MPGALQVLETSTLDFSRYGTTLFEVLFAGGRMTAGGSLEESEFYLKQNVRASLYLIANSCQRLSSI